MPNQCCGARRIIQNRAFVLAAGAGMGLMMSRMALAGGVPVFNPAEEGVFTQTSGSPSVPGSPYQVALPISSRTPTLLKHTIDFPEGGNTNASAGLQNSQSSTQTKISIAAGTGISQTDPNGSETASSLEVFFDAQWAIPAGGFGVPLEGNFSLPVGVKVGFDGTASVSVKVDWDYIDSTTNTEVGLDEYVASQSWNNIGGDVSPLVDVTTLTAPTVLFTPSSLPAGDTLIMTADIVFTADADDPTLIEVPTVADFGCDGVGVNHDKIGSFSTDVVKTAAVPEPSTALLMPAGGVAALLFELHRRRKNQIATVAV